MKHLLFLCLWGLSAGFVSAQRTTELDITIAGLPPGGLINLLGVYGEQNFRADTVSVGPGGRFVFKRDTGYVPGFYYVLLPDNKGNLQLLLDKDPKVTLKTSADNLVGNMQVAGSLDNQLLYQNLKFQAGLEPEANDIADRLKKFLAGSPEYIAAKADADALQNKRTAHIESFRKNHPQAFFTKFKLAGQNPVPIEPKKADGITLDTAAQIFAYRMNFFNDMDFNDTRLLYTPVYYNKLKRFITELTPQHQDSIILYADYITQKTINNKELFKFTANWIAMNYKPGKSSLMDCDAVYAHMLDKYWTNELAFWSDEKEIRGLRQQAKQMKGSLLNNIGQDVVAKDINGVERRLYDSKAKFLVVYIYSPNCEHCQEQTPKLWQMYQELHPSGLFDVYSIVATTTPGEWADYKKKVGFTWPDIYDKDPFPSRWPLKYHVDITPEIYLLDPDRRIIAKNINVTQLREILDRERAKRGL
jgi:thiol-disulfide isomerase/thioredoxin